MASEDSFYENYLLIKPEEYCFYDLARFLYSNKSDKTDFVEEAELIEFFHRWVVFISVLLQKIFIHLKKPVAALGFAVELLLNYPTSNGGYRHLIFNLLTGRLVRPDKSSATFRSIIGISDKRLDLDTKYEDANLAVMASKLSYENELFVRNVVTHRWQMEFLGFYNLWNDYLDENTTYAILFRKKNIDPNMIIVAFRGTDPFNIDAWRADIDISWYRFKGIGKIHSGFMKALGLQKYTGWPKQIALGQAQKSFGYYTIREKLKTLINENRDTKFILTGHSLGGALAILLVSILAMHEEEMMLMRLKGVYTFGQPRVGNKQFGEWMKEKMKTYGVEYFRYVYSNDVVPRLPYDDDKNLLFEHFGPCLYFNSCYKGQILEEEPNKNYFSLLYVVPKILTGIYQLIRSFVLPWTRGEEYEEGWFMRLARVTTLLIPGFTDHFLVNYVNVTRLGKLPPSVYLKEK